MPAFQKRVAEKATVSSPKKLKLTPIQSKVEDVVAALESDDLQVPGSKQNRQMILALAPYILETPRDSRHPKQEELGEIYKEVFLLEGERLKGKVQETQADIEGASADMTTRKAAVEAANAEVEGKNAALKEIMATLAADVGLAQTAKSTLDETIYELTTLAETKDLQVSEQQDVVTKAESFALLKDGQWEAEAPKDKIKELGSFFRKLKVDSSLVAALPLALARKPEERSQFDTLAATELEKSLTSKVEECASKVKETDAMIAQKTGVKGTQESALTAALTKQRAGAEALLKARAEHKDLTATLAEKNTQVMEGQTVSKALEAELSQRTSEGERHQEIQGTLTELLERQNDADQQVAIAEEAQEQVAGEEVQQ